LHRPAHSWMTFIRQSCSPDARIWRVCSGIVVVIAAAFLSGFPGLCVRFPRVTADAAARRPFPVTVWTNRERTVGACLSQSLKGQMHVDCIRLRAVWPPDACSWPIGRSVQRAPCLNQWRYVGRSPRSALSRRAARKDDHRQAVELFQDQISARVPVPNRVGHAAVLSGQRRAPTVQNRRSRWCWRPLRGIAVAGPSQHSDPPVP
jgi:hypothetical protein